MRFNPNIVYVAKCLHNEGSKDKQYMIAVVLTIPWKHGGLVRIFSMVKDSTQPMIISNYWNGGHLEHWCWLLRSNGNQAPLSWFKESEDEKYRYASTKSNYEHIEWSRSYYKLCASTRLFAQ